MKILNEKVENSFHKHTDQIGAAMKEGELTWVVELISHPCLSLHRIGYSVYSVTETITIQSTERKN